MGNKRILATIIITYIFAGCSFDQKLGSTERATRRMDKKLSETNQHTESMDQKLDKTNEHTESMRQGLDDTNDQIGKMKESLDTTNGHIEEMGNKIDDTNAKMDEMSGNIEEMAETTGDVKEATQDMNENLSGLTDTIHSLETKMGELTADARQVLAADFRTTAFQKILDAPYIEQKFSEAGKYYMAFEYQLWKEDSLFDRNKRLEALHLNAAQEYFRTVHGYISKHNYSLSPNSKNNEMNSLYALAAIIHAYNANIEVYDDPNLDENLPKSVLDMIEVAFREHHEVLKGTRTYDDMASYAKEVMVWEEDAEYLLQLRHNYIAAIIVHKLAMLESARHDGLGLGDEWRMARIFLRGWNPRIDYYAQKRAKLEEMVVFLEEVVRIRMLLQETGYTTRHDGQLENVLNKMRINGLNDFRGYEKQVENNEQLADFLSHIHCIRDYQVKKSECQDLGKRERVVFNVPSMRGP